MTPPSKSSFQHWPTWTGAAAGLLWGVAAALLSDRTNTSFWVDVGIRAVVVVTMTLLGAGVGWLCRRGINAARRRCKRP